MSRRHPLPARLLAVATTLLLAGPAQAAVSLGLWGDVPGASFSHSASSDDPGWQNVTHIGGHGGLLYDPGPSVSLGVFPGIPNVYGGSTMCGTFLNCSVSDVMAYGSVNAQYGAIRLYARAETPVWGYHAAGIGAGFTDTLTMNPLSSGMTLRFDLDSSHHQSVQLPESSFPGGDYQFSLTLRRPDSAAPPGCGSSEAAPPCDHSFFEMRFWSYWDVPEGRSAWAWTATGWDLNGLQNLGASDSGWGNGTRFEVFAQNPQQTVEVLIEAQAQADCVRTAGGNCRVAVDSSHSAYVQFVGDFQSGNGYQYLGTTALVPEPQTAGLWLAGLAGLGAWLQRRRRRDG